MGKPHITETTLNERRWPRVFEFRFVVVLRGEGSEQGRPPAEWRGWIRRVPDVQERDAGAGEQQVAFACIEDIPRIVRHLMGLRP